MHAAVLHAPHDLRYEDAPVPEPKPDEVLVRIRANGLCGSDIHFFDHGELGPFRVDRPYIPGHEASGVVARAAQDGSGPAHGTRVAVEPGIPCRRCEHCKKGRYNLCEDVVFLSAPPVNGTFAEYVAVASDFAHPLPDDLDDESGAFIEPISVGIQAMQRGRFQAGGTALVLGAGPIGLVTQLVAQAYGAGAVYAMDLLDHRLELAAQLGAAGTISAGTGDPVATFMDLTGGRGADFVFDTTGSSKASAMAPFVAARGGTIVQVGWPEKSRFPYPMEEVIEKELSIHGVNRYCNTFPVAIGLLASGRIDVSPLISHRFDFSQVVDAFAFATENRSETIKVMILSEDAGSAS